PYTTLFRAHERDDLVFLEALGAVERHVLEHVREAELILFLENRARLDDEPQRRAILRLGVLADQITQAVLELAVPPGGIDGQRGVERRTLGPLDGRGRRLCADLCGTGGEDGGGQQGGHAGRRRHSHAGSSAPAASRPRAKLAQMAAGVGPEAVAMGPGVTYPRPVLSRTLRGGGLKEHEDNVSLRSSADRRP